MKEELKKKFIEEVITKKWEEANRFWKEGVNPSAYKIGADAAFNFFMQEIEALEKENEKIRNFNITQDGRWREKVETLEAKLKSQEAIILAADEVIENSNAHSRFSKEYYATLEKYTSLKEKSNTI